MSQSLHQISLKRLRKYLFVFFFSSLPVILLFSFFIIQYSLDSTLKQNASIILAISSHELSEMENQSHIKVFNKNQDDILFQVFVDNKLTLHSKNIPNFKLMNVEGFKTITINNQVWRVFHLEEDGISLSVGENLTKRYYIVGSLLLLITLLYSCFYFIISYFLKRTMNNITYELEKNIEDIYQDKETLVLDELTPIINKINTYKFKINEQNIKEREFLEHVSHELRTPLSILKINIEQTNNEILLKSYDKIENIITQFLLLSKGETGVMKDISIVETITKSVEDIITIYPSVDFNFEIIKDFNITFNSDLLKLVFNNFIMNSINKGSEQITIKIDNNKVIIEDFCSPLEDKIRGYGIGLLLVNKILKKINSSYSLENNESNGVTATILFNC